jgi:hypothetical protein
MIECGITFVGLITSTQIVNELAGKPRMDSGNRPARFVISRLNAQMRWLVLRGLWFSITDVLILKKWSGPAGSSTNSMLKLPLLTRYYIIPYSVYGIITFSFLGILGLRFDRVLLFGCVEEVRVLVFDVVLKWHWIITTFHFNVGYCSR